MRKCHACKGRIPLGTPAHPYPLDELDRYILGIRPGRTLLYFHERHYWKWLKAHAANRKRVVRVRGLPSWHRRE